MPVLVVLDTRLDECGPTWYSLLFFNNNKDKGQRSRLTTPMNSKLVPLSRIIQLRTELTKLTTTK
jgi:hypothetical protein